MASAQMICPGGAGRKAKGGEEGDGEWKRTVSRTWRLPRGCKSKSKNWSELGREDVAIKLKTVRQ